MQNTLDILPTNWSKIENPVQLTSHLSFKTSFKSIFPVSRQQQRKAMIADKEIVVYEWDCEAGCKSLVYDTLT